MVNPSGEIFNIYPLPRETGRYYGRYDFATFGDSIDQTRVDMLHIAFDALDERNLSAAMEIFRSIDAQRVGIHTRNQLGEASISTDVLGRVDAEDAYQLQKEPNGRHRPTLRYGLPEGNIDHTSFVIGYWEEVLSRVAASRTPFHQASRGRVDFESNPTGSEPFRVALNRYADAHGCNVAHEQFRRYLRSMGAPPNDPYMETSELVNRPNWMRRSVEVLKVAGDAVDEGDKARAIDLLVNEPPQFDGMRPTEEWKEGSSPLVREAREIPGLHNEAFHDYLLSYWMWVLLFISESRWGKHWFGNRQNPTVTEPGWGLLGRQTYGIPLNQWSIHFGRQAATYDARTILEVVHGKPAWPQRHVEALMVMGDAVDEGRREDALRFVRGEDYIQLAGMLPMVAWEASPDPDFERDIIPNRRRLDDGGVRDSWKETAISEVGEQVALEDFLIAYWMEVLMLINEPGLMPKGWNLLRQTGVPAANERPGISQFNEWFGRPRQNPARAPTSVSVRKIYAGRTKLEATIVDVNEGRLSYSSGTPIRVSRLDQPRGAFFVVDGHHRIVEAIRNQQDTIGIAIDSNIPRIERTGGAYKGVVDEKVNVYDFVRMRQNPAFERAMASSFQTRYVDNPSWVTQAITESYEELEAQVPAKWLPKLSNVRPGARGKSLVGQMPEYGCGAYGCVLPTLDPKVVLKATTDSTESEFAAQLAPDLVVPVTVAYHMVVSLPAKREHRRIFLLWREEAKKVGEVNEQPGYGQQARDLIHEQHLAAQQAFDSFQQGAGEAEISMAVNVWKEACRKMGTLAELAYLSRGILTVLEKQRIFFGDVHEGNLGLSPRNGKLEWIITDPGHVAVLQA